MTAAAPLQRKPLAAVKAPAPATPRPALQAQLKPGAAPAYLQRGAVQTAGAGGGGHDPAEREAEATARAIVRMPDPGPTPAASVSQQAAGPQRAPARETQAAAPAPAAGGSGLPLPISMRRFMEPRFKANFAAVRIHTDERAASLNRELSARAFTTGNDIYFGAGEYQPETQDGAELIAHELTHVIQQGGVKQAAGGGAPAVTATPKSGLQRLGISDVLDYFADKANNIPGFRMFTIILGFNPINGADVERSGANILRAIIEFLPGGKLITDALEKYNVFAKAGAWIDTQFQKLGDIGTSIRNAIGDFIDSLGWSDIFHLGRVWDRAKRIFTDPIDKIIDFGKGLVTGIIKLVKDAVLIPLAQFIKDHTSAWDLLCALLGRDPITDTPVPRTAETLIGGFMKLAHQEDVWKRIKESNTVGKAFAWFERNVKVLWNLIVSLPRRALDAFRSLELMDIIVLPRAVGKVLAVFGNFVLDFLSWAGKAAWDLLELVFSVVSPGAWGYIQKTGAALQKILKNPLPFVSNLAKSAKGGFQTFAARFLAVHLPGGLSDWLLGSLPGVYIPKAFSLPEIAKFAMSALGLSWGNIRAKLVKVIGETAMKVLEASFDIVVTLVRDGPAAAWEKIQNQLSNLKEMVIGAITGLVVDYVVTRGIPKLVSMFIPGAGFITAIISIYEMIMVFVNKIATIIQVVTGFVDSIAAIAAGAIGAAIGKVENVLAGLVKLAINFLAGFAGLGKAADKIMGVLEKVRAPIDKALDWLVAWIVAAAKAAGKFVAKGAAKLTDWWREKLGFTNDAGERHTLFFQGEGEAAKLAIATQTQSVQSYLDAYPDKDSAEFKLAQNVFDRSNRVIFTNLKKNLAENERRQDIKGELATISAAFAKLAGEPPKANNYPATTEPTYNPYKIEYIVGVAKGGTKPPKGRDTGTPGWAKVYDAGLTTAPDKWVQMHIISEALGGRAVPENLVPAPNSINSGPFRSFELLTAGLAKDKSKKSKNTQIKNVVWAEFKVAYHGDGFVKSIQGQSGLYFWMGATKTPNWLKNEKYSFFAQAAIPVPQLESEKKYSLNFSAGVDLEKIIRDDKLVELIKQGRRYPNMAEFVRRMEERAKDAGVKNYKVKIQNIVGHPKVVLNDPPPST